MLYSQIFGKTKKDLGQKKYDSISHQFLTQAGFIDQVGSGIYSLLTLGKIALSKIEMIIRDEMVSIDALEIQMPILHPRSYWERTNRWKEVDVLFKTKSRFGQDYGLAPTHEEIVVPLVKKWVNSYRDLPIYLYHITQKFRDEPRPKSGILRGREFGMKDLYSFHADKKDFEKYYQRVIKTYLKIFKRCGLDKIKITEASGGSFTKKYSHEFNVLTPAGEINLIYCQKCSFTQNKEIFRNQKLSICPKCKKERLNEEKAIEVGNIFDLGTRFSQSFDLKYADKNGQFQYCYMGCYGIGTTRLLGTIVEINHDNNGIIWPNEVTPFKIYLVGLDLKNESIKKRADDLYHSLKKENIAVLYDDRTGVSAGEKLNNADLLGFPFRLVISKKTGKMIELKERKNNKTSCYHLGQLINRLKKTS